jgi:hypothetical protein
MTTNSAITHIFDELTFTSEFKYTSSISINKKKTPIQTIGDKTTVTIGEGEYTFWDNEKKIEVFKNKIDVYTLTNTYFYKNTTMPDDVLVYKPIDGFILNKHVINMSPHHKFDLKKTNMVYFKKVSYFNYYFVFDIEDKRETLLNSLYDTFNPYNMPPEMVDHIVSFLNKSDFPFDFAPKYGVTMPAYFIKEQLLQLYEMGVLKIACHDTYCSSMNILTDEAYDYVFPNNQSNKIVNKFPTKKDMNDFVDDLLEEFFKNTSY